MIKVSSKASIGLRWRPEDIVMVSVAVWFEIN